MFQIDKEKFEEFVASLRKEKGLTQKQLAACLYVSDKAVSKWERGLSIPDAAILVPLAQTLGVTVTELLKCSRLPEDSPMDARQTEQILQKVIRLSETDQKASRPYRIQCGMLLLLCALLGGGELWLLMRLGYSEEALAASLFRIMGLMALFGACFCLFIPARLPDYYDAHRISGFSDGFVRMNLPGVYFNNRNWPHVVGAVRLWAMVGLVFAPAVFLAADRLLGHLWKGAGMYIVLCLSLCSLLVSVFVLARKYEFAPDEPNIR